MLIVVLAALISATPPSRPLPQASVQKYRVELSVRSEVDLTAVGAPSQVQEQGAVGFITITLSDSAGGKAMLVVLDSATFNAGELPVPGDLVAQSKGATYRGFVDASGRIHGLTASADNVLAAMIHSALGDFFPRTRPGAVAGQQWTDTLELISKPAGGSLTTNLITEFTAGPREQFQGREASTLGVRFTTRVMGTMETPGGAAGMAGDGSGTGSYYIASSGLFLGGSRSTTQNAIVTLAAASMEIPVKSTTMLVVTPLP